METSLFKKLRFNMSTGIRFEILYQIANILILLFIYTAVSKVLTFHKFEAVLAGSVLIGRFNTFAAIFIIVAELIISAMLVIPKTRKAGVLASMILLLLFTLYLIYMVYSKSDLPCSCGGVISSMSWTQHIFFNCFLIVLAGSALIVNPSKKD